MDLCGAYKDIFIDELQKDQVMWVPTEPIKMKDFIGYIYKWAQQSSFYLEEYIKKDTVKLICEGVVERALQGTVFNIYTIIDVFGTISLLF